VVGTSGATRLPAANLEQIELRGIDPAAGLRGVRARTSAGDTESLAPDAWDSAIAAGRVAIAHQIIGACRTMLELARTHALEREQFGHPIARFQAVRHRLADALVAIEASDAALGAATDAPGTMTAALAKAVAGRNARIVARHCQQVLAGIGFTTDHPFHRFMKRTMVLDGLLGAADNMVFDIGRTLLATRQVPTLVEL
jgi:alkylation response protein AidB-like acyl-CoA dehydrogenase